VVRFGPIPSTLGGWLDTTGWSTHVVVKVNERALDSTGTKIDGVFQSADGGGDYAVYTLPASVTGQVGHSWIHALVVSPPPDSYPETIKATTLIVEAV